MPSNNQKRRPIRFRRGIAVNIVIVAASILLAVLCIYPFFYLFINTISDNSIVDQGHILFYPVNIHADNYVSLIKSDVILKSLCITALRTVIGTALMVFASAWAGYLLTKQKMWSRAFWYRFFVIALFFDAGVIPWVTNMSMLGLRGHFLAYILPGIASPVAIILLKNSIEAIPSSLEESALIDGASVFRIFNKIICPLSAPALTSIAIIGAITNWNSFRDSFLLMSSTPDLMTIQHVLYNTLNQLDASASSVMSSGNEFLPSALNGSVIGPYTIAIISLVPVLFIYPFLRTNMPVNFSSAITKK